MKIFDIAKSHTQITTVSFSHKYRIYLVVTEDFKFIFMNELYYVVYIIDMTIIRLVHFVHFCE